MHVFDRYLNDTNSPADPWYIVDAKNRKWAELQVLETLVSGIETALKTVILLCRCYRMCSRLRRFRSFLRYHLIRNCLRKNTKGAKNLQSKLSELHNKLYRRKIPVVIAYEGWDAAGKGGNIKRITGALDPRGFEVHPIASPLPNEKARHYLWRFWNRLPKTGHIAILTGHGMAGLW